MRKQLSVIPEDSGGYFQYCSVDEPNWKACTEKEYAMYEDLPMFATRINPQYFKGKEYE